jgi:hypothetical protein
LELSKKEANETVIEYCKGLDEFKLSKDDLKQDLLDMT